MAAIDDLDFTTRNLVIELLRECKSKLIPISEHFLIYYIELLILNPSWGIVSGKLPNRNNVQKLVKYCIQKLENLLHPRMIILKMQLYFQDNFHNLSRVVEKHRVEIKIRLKPLLKEIVEVDNDRSETDLNTLLKKIVFLITLYSGLGNPSIDNVYEEAQAALKSIITDTDLIAFDNASSSNKKSQLLELSELVMGIRLFNRDCNKGGAGIEDLPKLLLQGIEIYLNELQKSLTTIMENVYALTTAVDNCYKLQQTESDSYELILNLPSGIAEKDVDDLKDTLLIYRQCELFVRKILVETMKMEVSSKHTVEKFHEGLRQIHKTLQFKIAIPTVQIFPLFSTLATIWRQLQDQTITLSQLHHILNFLEQQVKNVPIDENILRVLIEPDGPVTDADRLEKTIGVVIPPNPNVSVLNISKINNFAEITLEYMGFCAWKFIETRGGLIPGNSNMGVVHFGNKYYVFSSLEAATEFSSNPKRNVLRGLDLAREKPELINLMQLEEQLREVSHVEQLVIELPPLTVTFDNETQTDIHPIPTNIDPDYKWNIWDWKRQAILFANLSRRVTTSSQTIKSRALEASHTQTYDNKNVEQQTKRNNYTNVPTLSNYIYGLRGRTDNNQHIITLTRPIDENDLRPKCDVNEIKNEPKRFIDSAIQTCFNCNTKLPKTH